MSYAAADVLIDRAPARELQREHHNKAVGRSVPTSGWAVRSTWAISHSNPYSFLSLFINVTARFRGRSIGSLISSGMIG